MSRVATLDIQFRAIFDKAEADYNRFVDRVEKTPVAIPFSGATPGSPGGPQSATTFGGMSTTLSGTASPNWSFLFNQLGAQIVAGVRGAAVGAGGAAPGQFQPYQVPQALPAIVPPSPSPRNTRGGGDDDGDFSGGALHSIYRRFARFGGLYAAYRGVNSIVQHFDVENEQEALIGRGRDEELVSSELERSKAQNKGFTGIARRFLAGRSSLLDVEFGVGIRSFDDQADIESLETTKQQYAIQRATESTFKSVRQRGLQTSGLTQGAFRRTADEVQFANLHAGDDLLSIRPKGNTPEDARQRQQVDQLIEIEKKSVAALGSAQFDAAYRNLQVGKLENDALAATLAHSPLGAIRARAAAGRAGLVGAPDDPNRIQQERRIDLEQRQQEADLAFGTSQIDISQAGRRRAGAFELAHDPTSAGAASAYSQSLAAAESLRFAGRDAQANEELRLGIQHQELLRQDLLEGFHGRTLSAQNFSTNNPRAEQDVSKMMDTISKNIQDLTAAVKNLTAN